MALIYRNTYAISTHPPPPTSTFKGFSLIYIIIIEAIQSSQYSLIISQVTIHIHTTDLFGALILQYRCGISLENQRKQWLWSRRAPSKKKKKTPSAQSQPMAFLIVILLIALISSLLLQHHLGTCDCTLSIRTKWLWLHSKCYLPNYTLLLRTSQHGIKMGCSWDSQPCTDTLLLNVAEQRDNYHDNQAFNYSWRLRQQSFNRQTDK